MKFIDNFVCGIGKIYGKYYQDTLFIIQNIEEMIGMSDCDVIVM